MLSTKSFLGGVVLILGLLAGAGYLYHRDTEYRRIYGRVTEVSLFNWVEEVDQVKDQKPVLIYFEQPRSSPLGQRQEVEKVAWDYAGKVKVVRIDWDPRSRPANLVFSIRYGVVRCPAFVILYKDKEIHGTDGVYADSYELKRLLGKVREP